MWLKNCQNLQIIVKTSFEYWTRYELLSEYIIVLFVVIVYYQIQMQINDIVL